MKNEQEYRFLFPVSRKIYKICIRVLHFKEKWRILVKEIATGYL